MSTVALVAGAVAALGREAATCNSPFSDIEGEGRLLRHHVLIQKTPHRGGPASLLVASPE